MYTYKILCVFILANHMWSRRHLAEATSFLFSQDTSSNPPIASLGLFFLFRQSHIGKQQAKKSHLESVW